MFAKRFAPGDPVVYRKQKRSTRPGNRAKRIEAARFGEDYYYEVDKYWVVREFTSDDCLIVQTRRGKTHVIHGSDKNLRRAYLWERIFYRDRFPKLPHDAAGTR